MPRYKVFREDTRSEIFVTVVSAASRKEAESEAEKFIDDDSRWDKVEEPDYGSEILWGRAENV